MTSSEAVFSISCGVSNSPTHYKAELK